VSDASTVSDKTIMANTQVESQATSGRIRFATKLPSGRDINSEWVQESSKTAGVIQWCGAVRAEIVADQEEDRARAKRKAFESRQVSEATAARLATSPQGSGAARIVGPDSTPIIPTAPLSTISGGSAGQSLSSDPVAFIEQQVQMAQESVTRLRAAYLQTGELLSGAERSLAQWTAIRLSLGKSPQTPSSATTPTTSDGEA
jgi:hypothetical protein